MISVKILERKVIMRIRRLICETGEELLESDAFKEFVRQSIKQLQRKNSILLEVFNKSEITERDIETLTETFQFLYKMEAHLLPKIVPGSEVLLRNPVLLNDLVEYLYNYWRNFDRFIICDSAGDQLDKRPYRTFNDTVEKMTHIVRSVYRDIQENITGKHPRVYRQVSAGAEVAAIALPKDVPFPDEVYKKLKPIPIIRQILLYPPLILNPPMNKRTGKFEKISQNPLDLVTLNSEEWLCYPAKVGELIILIYFHEKFYELGFSLCNLFELADDEDLQRKPAAVYTFGVPESALANLGVFPTVFYDDEKNDMLVAAVPNKDEFGYFGYLKKMVLTLHNIKMMKAGRFPYHGALVKIIKKDNKAVTILIIGDTGTGKSEGLEAFRALGDKYIKEFIVIADDMGSLEIAPDGSIIGYGTEIGAFLRLDDLQPGYAFGQMDRAIIMSPTQINARIVMPVTNFEQVIKGHKVDFVLYANNYEDIDDEHPIIERFSTPEQAIPVFREGTAMSKGTTTSTGLVHSYFANIFGPPQYKALHEQLAEKYFAQFFKQNLFVGQIRTRLGICGFEQTGPLEAAKALFQIIYENANKE